MSENDGTGAVRGGEGVAGGGGGGQGGGGWGWWSGLLEGRGVRVRVR